MPRFPSLNDLWRSVVRVFSPEIDPLLVLAATVAVLFLGVLTNALYGLAQDVLGEWLGSFLAATPILLVLLLCIPIIIVIRFYILRRRRPDPVVGATPSPHRGLIWIMSPVTAHALVAIQYHAQGLATEQQPLHCWVLYTANDALLEKAYHHLQQQVQDLPLVVQWHPRPLDVDPDTRKASAGAVERAVRNIYKEDAPAVGLTAADVITDITAGTRPMVAGAVMACTRPPRPMEYVDSEYDPMTNRPIPGRQRIIKVE